MKNVGGSSRGRLRSVAAGLSEPERRYLEELRRLVYRARVTLKQLEQATGFADSNWSRYLSGRTPVPDAALTALAAAVRPRREEWLYLLELRRGADAARRARRDAPGPEQPVATSGVPRQLPAASRHFAGRQDVLAWLDEHLPAGDAGAVPIVALHGGAGVGKTALAVHWAHQVAARFDGGQLYADLRGSTPGAQPLTAAAALVGFLRALGVPAGDLPADEAELASAYRTLVAGRRLLVVLDDARSAAQIRPLLPGHAGCLVLVTSRNDLPGLVASHGARSRSLDLLTPDEAVDLLTRLLGRQDRLADLARLCAYLPLALRIVAAKLRTERHRQIADVVAQLASGNRLDVLEVEDDPGAAVRVAFDTAYDALPPADRRTFRLLGVVPGPDTAAAAVAALAGTEPGDAARILGRLARRHLVDEHLPGRYRLHDLLHAYAQDRCRAAGDAPEAQEALERLLAYYLEHADSACRMLNPPVVRLPDRPAPVSAPPSFPGRAEALNWLAAEQPNLVAAVARTAGDGPRPFAWQLADALRGYFAHWPHPTDAPAVGEAGLAAAQDAAHPLGEAAMHLFVGQTRWRLGDLPTAATHLIQAITASRAARWTDGEAAANGILGTVYERLGRLSDADRHHRRALAIDRRSGNRAHQAVHLTNLGNVHFSAGNLRRAAGYTGRSLALNRELGDDVQMAINLGNLSGIYHRLGRAEEAADVAVEAIAEFGRLGLPNHQAETLHSLAEIERDAGCLDAAGRHAHEALEIARQHGSRTIETEAYNALGSIHRCLGEPDVAAKYHDDALAVAREIPYPAGEAEALLGLAALDIDRHRAADAIGYADAALATARAAALRLLEGDALTTLARAHALAGDHAAALDAATAALAIHQATGHRPGVVATRRILRLLAE